MCLSGARLFVDRMFERRNWLRLVDVMGDKIFGLCEQEGFCT